MVDATKQWYNHLRTGDDADLRPALFKFDSDPSTYMSSDWTDWVESVHVRRQYATAGDHEAHGVAERHIGVCKDMAFAMLHYCDRGKQYFFMAFRMILP